MLLTPAKGGSQDAVRLVSGDKHSLGLPFYGYPRFRLLLTLAVLGTLTIQTRADDWPQWLGPQRDGVWREDGILEKFPAAGPKILWRTPIGAGYSGPAVAHGRVYITDRTLAKGVKNPKNPFAKTALKGMERILCLDEASGKTLWTHEYPCDYEVSYPAGPRTTPLVVEGKVYTLGCMGDLLCLNAATGKAIWSKNFVKDYQAPVPLWGFSSHPLLDGDQLICLVGGKDHVVMAFHKNTGKELWHALSASQIGYSPPTIVEMGGKRQLIIWDADAVNGLDPTTGAVYWTQPFPVRVGMSIVTPRLAGDLLFVSSFYNGSMMLKMDREKPAAQVLWKGKSKSEMPRLTDGLHSVMCTPFLKDGHIYGVCSYGELRCLKADTGKRLWMTMQATGNQKKPVERWAHTFMVAQGDRYFLFNEKGDLIIARLLPEGYQEISRAHIVAPTNLMAGRPVVWSHPAFANRCIYVRNDKEIICVSLAAKE